MYPSLTLSESGVIDNGNIFVVVTKGVKGGSAKNNNINKYLFKL